MKTHKARKIVIDHIVVLERELAHCERFTDKRMILQNLQACQEMLMYLDLIEQGREPKFKVLVDATSLFVYKEIEVHA